MADTDDSGALRLWSLATFHTVSFMVLVAGGFHLRGSLAAVLKPLGTNIGFGLFVILWMTTWWTTRLGLRLMKAPVEEVSPTTVVFSAVTAGGWNGLATWIMLIVGAAAVRFASAPPTLGAVPGLFLVLAIGSLVAFAVGGTIGACFGIADALLIYAGAALFQATALRD